MESRKTHHCLTDIPGKAISLCIQFSNVFVILMATMSMEVIIISGHSGSGKTSVAFEICEQPRQHQIPHANIDRLSR